MSALMRAKMVVQGVRRTSYSEELEFTCQYSANKEDNSFSEATPSGSCVLTITNKALWGKFHPQDAFYLDFTPVAAA